MFRYQSQALIYFMTNMNIFWWRFRSEAMSLSTRKLRDRLFSMRWWRRWRGIGRWEPSRYNQKIASEYHQNTIKYSWIPSEYSIKWHRVPSTTINKGNKEKAPKDGMIGCPLLVFPPVLVLLQVTLRPVGAAIVEKPVTKKKAWFNDFEFLNGNGIGMNGLTIECPSNPGVGIFFVVTVVNFICFDYFDSWTSWTRQLQNNNMRSAWSHPPILVSSIFPGASHHDGGRTQETGASPLQAGGDSSKKVVSQWDWGEPSSFVNQVQLSNLEISPSWWELGGKKLSIVNLFLQGSTSFAHFYPKGWSRLASVQLGALHSRCHWTAWRSLWRMMACHLGFPWTTKWGSWASLVPQWVQHGRNMKALLPRCFFHFRGAVRYWRWSRDSCGRHRGHTMQSDCLARFYASRPCQTDCRLQEI